MTTHIFFNPNKRAPYLSKKDDDLDSGNSVAEGKNKNPTLTSPYNTSSSYSIMRQSVESLSPLRQQQHQKQQRPTTTHNHPIGSISPDARCYAAKEADAAAGGGGGGTGTSSFQQRVTSFSNLLRSPSIAQQQRPVVDATKSLHSTTNRRSRRYDQNNIRIGNSPKQNKIVESTNATQITPDWRLRDRMKTVCVGLVVALNVGTDPPDVIKPYPCAVLQTWMDPRSMSRSKALERIGERLQNQYAKWQLAARHKQQQQQQQQQQFKQYRKALDPTVEDVRNLCLRLRQQARQERVLLHYNGHGVPRPTDRGEIWVFDKNHTEYIPLSMQDLKHWLGKPSIVVLDCSAAGILLPFLTASSNGDDTSTTGNSVSSLTNQQTPSHRLQQHASLSMDEQASQWVNNTIVLCPCSEHEWLPMHPDYPADIFTSCLTTPIQMALRWFVNRNPDSMAGLKPEVVDMIPGAANDRKTPLGELNWIFTAVTDSIGWNVLPKPLFQRLLRQDLLVASMFRNFLLADRILRSMGCTPVSSPPIPPETAHHPLWQAWDLACETLLFQLIRDGILGNHVLVNTNKNKTSTTVTESTQYPEEDTLQSSEATPIESNAISSVSSPFFSEMLNTFETWLDFSEIHKMKLQAGVPLESPEQLPVVLQVLLSPVHRIRALRLLRRFFDLGPWAVNLSLSLGIFPYVMKLLQSPEYKNLLISIWASILAFDPSCRINVLKDGAFHHFVQHLMWGLNNTTADVAEAAKERTLAAFVLTVACHEYPAGQAECVRLNLHGHCCALLSSYEQGERQDSSDETVELHLPAHFRLWLCLCLASIVKDNAPMQTEAYSAGVLHRLTLRIHDKNADVRAAVAFALGSIIGVKRSKQQGGCTSMQGFSPLQQQQQLQVLQHQQHQQQFMGSAANWMSQQHLAPTMVLPGTVPLMVASTGQIPQTFAQSGTGGLHLPIQHLQAMTAVPQIHLSQPLQSSGQIWNQNTHLPTNPQLQTPPYVVHRTQGPATGFFVGNSGPILSQSGSFPANISTPRQTPPFHVDTRSMLPTVYEDRNRFELDLTSMEILMHGVEDGSVVVRYEAILALGVAVVKYLDAFLLVALEFTKKKKISSIKLSNNEEGDSLTPRGLENKDIARLREIWLALKDLQRQDPFPAIAQAANKIVCLVHENLLIVTTESTGGSRLKHDQNAAADILYGGVNEKSSPIDPNSSLIPLTKDNESSKADMRRVMSEVATLSRSGGSGMGDNTFQETAINNSSATDFAKALNTLPKTRFYEWKKNIFDLNFRWLDECDDTLDPLSPTGAIKGYQTRRNFVVKENANELANRYECLAPKPPKPKKKNIEMILEEEDEEEVTKAEEEVSTKKRELEMTEKCLFRNPSEKMTSLIAFHPYEDYLVACSVQDVAVWDIEGGNMMTMFSNGNPNGSRMTSANWINEDSSAIFLTGSDDGTVKLYDLQIGNVSYGPQLPVLISAFQAVPMKAGHFGSGLVTEWQPFSGTLIAGGNSKYLLCWDLEAEKIVNKMETFSDAYITTLTTAWDYDRLGTGRAPHGYSEISQDIIVAGHSDGSLKIFDIRMKNVASELQELSSYKSTHRSSRISSYSEHKSYVVTTAFRGYQGRYELISGTVSGQIKAWDLRLSASIRTLDIQRSTMTAFSVHSKIPIIATGSHAQFIKLATLDGDTLQVLRYHEKLVNHRIGPVSCIAFHPHKSLLAAGATDSYIGLYTTKRSPRET